MKSLSKKIVEIVRDLAPNGSVALHQPDLTGNEEQYTRDAIQSGWVSSVGQYVDRFEEVLAGITGVEKAVALVNGTCGLHLALHLCGVEKDSEVLTPALTFVGTTNAIVHAGAIPHFIDSAFDNMAICPGKLDAYLSTIADEKNGKLINKNTGRVISALVVVHVLGSAAPMHKIASVAKKYHLKVIEDAAEAMGSYLGIEHLGLQSDLAVISFNGNKIVTTGAGGALISRNQPLMEKAKHLSSTAKSSKEGFFYHDAVGFNFRMANINAAVGVAQLERLPEFLRHKKKLADYYRRSFQNSDMQFIEPGEGANCWLSAIRIKDSTESQINQMVEEVQAQGIMLRPLWMLNNRLPMYQQCPSMELACATAWVNSVICLPSSACLGASLSHTQSL
jgi:perosamine synthetase